MDQMRVDETSLEGVYIIKPGRIEDDRGFFSRIYCRKEFRLTGIPELNFVQINNSFNRAKGTLRGLHMQRHPHGEFKLVRCLSGSMYDVAVDLRPDSLTFGKYVSINLTAENRLAILIPPGVAHGYQTLEDDTEMLYFVTEYYEPSSEQTLYWRDETISIRWPVEKKIISKKDQEGLVMSQILAGL